MIGILDLFGLFGSGSEDVQYAKGGAVNNYRITPYKIIEVSGNPDMIEPHYSLSYTVNGSLADANESAQKYVITNSPQIVAATVTKIHPSGQALKHKKVSYITKDEIKKYANGGGVDEDIIIKEWYTKNYPQDDLGEELDDTNTFKDLWVAIHNGIDVYSFLGVGDSLIRERVFEQLSKINGVEYDYVYKKWLSSSDNYSNGGNLPENYKIEIISYDADVYEDDYEEGEGNHVNYFSNKVNDTVNNVDDLFYYISNSIISKDLTKEDFSILNNGSIATSILVDAENYPATNSEIELWKKGLMKLYSANYNINIALVDRKIPDAEQLSQILGIEQYKEGGTLKHKGKPIKKRAL